MTETTKKSLDRRIKDLLNIAALTTCFGLGTLFGFILENEYNPRLISSGVITKKKHSSERTYDVMLYLPGKINDKAVYDNKTVTLKDDEDYMIQFKRYYKEGIVKSRNVYVSKEVFNSLNLGDFFDTATTEHEDQDDDEILEIK